MGFLSDINPFGGSSQRDVTSTINRTPGPYQSYFDEILKQAQGLNQGRSPQYASLYGGISPETQQGVTELTQFQPQTSQAAGGYLQDVLGGNYLNANPYLDQTFQRGADQVQSRLGSQFAGANRTGSGAFAGASGQAYSDLANQIYGGNYQAERQRQMQAAGLAPSIDQANLGGAQAQLQAGGILDADTQRRLAEQERQANFGYNAGWDQLGRYLGAVSTATEPYGTQTQTVPYFGQNKGQGALGGIIGGGQFGSQFNSAGGIPWGSILGGIGGGILGGSG